MKKKSLIIILAALILMAINAIPQIAIDHIEKEKISYIMQLPEPLIDYFMGRLDQNPAKYIANLLLTDEEIAQTTQVIYDMAERYGYDRPNIWRTTETGIPETSWSYLSGIYILEPIWFIDDKQDPYRALAEELPPITAAIFIFLVILVSKIKFSFDSGDEYNN